MFINRKNLLLASSLVFISACSSDDKVSTGLSAPTLNDSTADAVSAILWTDCESQSELQCAELEVPVNYNDTEGEQTTIALIRKPAAADARQGSLLFNPGGPGGSGVELIEIFEEFDLIPDSVLAAYDIVGFDPRGLGGSNAVSCEEFGLDDIEGYPVDAASIQVMHQEMTSFANACAEKYGDYLQQLGSLNVVRDMEEIRKALAEDTLNFIGYSYGTRLAALYLQEYPSSSGRIILDASLPPNSSIIPLTRESLPAFQNNLEAMLQQCINTDPDCSVDHLTARLTTRINQLIVDPSIQAIQELDILAELISLSVEDPEFGLFAADPIIAYLNTYDAEVLSEFIVVLEQFGFGLDEQQEDDETVQVAVICADDAYRPDVESLVGLLDEFNQVSDPFAELAVSQAAMCSGWPEALEPLAPIAVDTAPLSLVIGGTSDAQTPLSWSSMMATAIGGFFISSNHMGHVAVFADKSDCLDDIAEQFLVEGLIPSTTECS